MKSAYRPAWWLPGPHAMTMWGKFFRPRVLPEMHLARIPTPDGDELSVASVESPGAAPILLILHGLEGGLQSHYLGGLVASALRQGWQPRVLLFRTCDGRMGPARRTYHSGETTDLEMMVRAVTREEPNRQLVLVGISLGGNVLLKWLGENGDSAPSQVRAAVAVSTPFDLARSSRAIGSGFSRLYQWNFLRSLKRKAREKLSQHPDIVAPGVLEQVRTMWEFDDVFTAPLHGFRDAADYYDRSSSIRFLAGIRRPTLLLSALDDPFHTPEVLRDVEAISTGNSCLVTEFHRRGGHVGFVGGAPWNPEYYLDARVAAFLGEHLARESRAGRQRTG